MFCPKCGQNAEAGVQFCSGCGIDLSNVNNVQNQGTGQKILTAMPSGIAPLIMGLLGMFGGFIPVVKYITGLLSLLAIIIGVSQRKKLKGAGLATGKATAGIVLGSIAVLITLISIIAIGALFSGGSSTRRINPITNSLPKEIQGTVWHTDLGTVEFGKNKIKLNDKWYRVKEITKGNLQTNWMFTYAFFDDNYITLQTMTNNTIKPARLNNEILKFMTPAEFESDTIEKERIAKEIVGFWEGTIKLRPNRVSYHLFLDADLTLNITYQKRQFQAEANFIITDSADGLFSGNYPVNSKGACILDITEEEGEYHFTVNEWTSPYKFAELNLNGSVKDNVFSGNTSVIYYGAGTFNVVKKK